MIKYSIQLFSGIILLVAVMLMSWYEGSVIIENSIEWKYSTPFTQFFNVHISTGKEIFYIDYLYYSLKMNPIYLCIALMSVVYIISLLSLINIKFNFVSVKISFTVLVVLMICLLLIGIVFLLSSTHAFKLFSLVSLLCFVAVGVLYVVLKKDK
ncbi:DUF4306 domain-containing protein [Priestia taiwanensis]|uniref:DUF4306 domain-containing protein n=1 Tax=Priestia taiwanensis TaxID=1347902 RepID=A0A917AJ65_9BACI|nr:DUF4306 domain-containing protein [Priestia taiwanensis]MBM7361810.1 magnesium-transporting ATPase (P-type) [Priestia taiwanensis]GGE57146.1 hypothetical protein GCM10007140_04350 [Priestia taiwanensis]